MHKGEIEKDALIIKGQFWIVFGSEPGSPALAPDTPLSLLTQDFVTYFNQISK